MSLTRENKDLLLFYPVAMTLNDDVLTPLVVCAPVCWGAKLVCVLCTSPSTLIQRMESPRVVSVNHPFKGGGTGRRSVVEQPGLEKPARPKS